MRDYKLFWGDSHTNLHLSARGDTGSEAGPARSEPGHSHTNLPSEVLSDLETSLAHARQVIDFWPIAYYPYTYTFENGFRKECWRDEEDVDAAWRAVCDLAEAGTREGEFVVFPGFEWQGDGRHGDHNVFFFDRQPPILRSRTLPELYEDIRRRNLRAFAIPHHTAYRVGVRAKDWSVHDEELSPFAEIFSLHGSSESDEEWIGLRKNWHMGPGVSGGTIEDALARGVHTGIVASADSHYGVAAVHGAGLMGCWAEALTRESLWEAFAQRRVYGVTGDRIELEFTAEGAPMGTCVRKAGAVRVLARVRGADALDRIELLRNNRVIATHCHNGAWVFPAGNDRVRAKLRVEVGWGPKPVDIPDQPPREWNCVIEVPEGAVIAAEPCWKTTGQWVGGLGGSRCEFGFRTSQAPPHGGVPVEATIFELEARPEDTVKIELEGKVVSMTLAEAAVASRLVDFMDEAADHARRECGVDAEALERKDTLYFYGHKAKIHRAIPEAGFAAELDHTDADPPAGRTSERRGPAPAGRTSERRGPAPAGANVYRVRVTQRNGQVAWSSPVWVEE